MKTESKPTGIFFERLFFEAEEGGATVIAKSSKSISRGVSRAIFLEKNLRPLIVTRATCFGLASSGESAVATVLPGCII